MSRLFISPVVNLLFREGKEKWMRAKYEGEEFLRELALFDFLLDEVSTVFTTTAEIHARSLANFYCQYADRHINLKFMRRVSERERAIRQFVIVKNKLMSVFNASVLLLIMNFVITLSK